MEETKEGGARERARAEPLGQRTTVELMEGGVRSLTDSGAARRGRE